WYLGCKVDTIDALIAAVQERADRGVDWVKVMATGGFRTQGSDPFVTQYTVEQLTTLVHAAHEHGMPIAAHAHATSGIAAAVAAGVDGIEHCTFVSEQGAVLDQATVEAMAARGIWAGITIAQPRDDLSSTTLAILEKKWGNVRTLMHSGVHVVFSTDAGIYSTKPHDVLAKELIYVASQGFTNLEVLTAATSIAADSCHVGHRKGRIAPHYDADVIAIPGNPLRNINELLNIQAVFRAGHRVR
ncbi:MAG: amidohydrolase family protein, partial [Candidatus Dormibacteraceae bacterium]